MVSEISLPALLGHFAVLLHNPNILMRATATSSSVIEDEAIAMLAAMLGFDPSKARGHFTSGGTVANFEGVWRARYARHASTSPPWSLSHHITLSLVQQHACCFATT